MANSLHVDDRFLYIVQQAFCPGFLQGQYIGVFLIGTAHASVKRGYLFSEPGGNSTASIVGFGPVKETRKNAQQAPHVMHGFRLLIIHQYS